MNDIRVEPKSPVPTTKMNEMHINKSPLADGRELVAVNLILAAGLSPKARNEAIRYGLAGVSDILEQTA